MKITVDTREQQNVLKILEQLGIPYTRRTMSAGDYQTKTCLAERKTVMDLVESIKGSGKRKDYKEGRFFSQMEKLRAKCDKTGQIPFLFISGDLKDAALKLKQHGLKLNKNAIMGAMASAMVRYGINVFAFFSDDKEMLYCMHSVFEKVKDGKYFLPHRAQLKRDRNKKVALWSTILRVRPKIVRDVIKKYKTLEKFLNVLKTRPNELEHIDGVGKGTVKKWKRLLE